MLLRTPQRRDLVLMLRRQVQRRSTRDEHAKRRPGAEQRAHDLRRAEKMLEVVDHEKSIEVGDGFRERLLDRSAGFLVDLERLRDRRGDQIGLRRGAELDDDGVGAGELSVTASARPGSAVRPAPVSVTSRVSSRSSKEQIAATSSARPTRPGPGDGRSAEEPRAGRGGTSAGSCRRICCSKVRSSGRGLEAELVEGAAREIRGRRRAALPPGDPSGGARALVGTKASARRR